ncbi:DUF4652 domain-containing protein [Clostridium estertheticum]|uniref:DUF4652 domain-containing protein n=1 Tax=Clostridium estertheticum TaxID=238834 RepID=UPI0013E93C3A|nr:DUF4652 domain-containing protein [Clostridium estertheticum]MBZ9689419.1 DUF4652 domain-containing protein [Clostridium estertheticum]
MNCNIFKNGLDDYVLGNTSNDLKIALEKHMDGCESCRRLYEEEVKIDKDFKQVLSIGGIEFNSSRAGIINSIDKNRYSKKTSNKILYNFKRYKNRYLSYAVAVMAMIVILPIMLKGFAGGNYKTAANKPTTMADSSSKDSSNSSAKVGAVSPESSIAMEKTDQKNVPLQNGPLQFQKSIIAKLPILSYELKWKNSIDGKRSAAIDTVIGGDVDFGIHIIYIKNLSTNEIVKYEVVNNERQFTPRNIEWWDNEHLIIVAGYGYGTIEYGSEVYSLNVNTAELSTLYQRKDKKQQIVDFKVVGKDLIFQLLIYDDDTYNDYHKGSGKMTLSQLDKSSDIQIISDGKK